MATCMQLFFIVGVPLLAIIAFFCLQSVKVEFHVMGVIKSDIDTVFDYFKNPENLIQVVPSITDVRVLEHNEKVLDDADGFFKDTYLVTITQDFPHREGVKFNFTRTASKEQNRIESQGEIAYFLQYHTLHRISGGKDGTVKVLEDGTMTLPRALAWWIGGDAEQNHAHLMTRIKEAIESKKRDVKI